jgi:hypothetical protein
MTTHNRGISRLAHGALLASAAGVLAIPANADETLLCHKHITSVPFAITQPGHYCLVRDLRPTVAAPFAISIEADSVWLDLNNFVLDGSAARISTGISSEFHKDITVRNGRVHGFSRAGVVLDGDSGSNNLTVDGIQTDSIKQFGIWVRGGTGLVVRNNVVTNTGGTPSPNLTGCCAGIAVVGSGTVMNNDVINIFTAFPQSQGPGTGINLGGAVGGPYTLLAVGNRVTKSTGAGISCTTFSGSEVVLRDNTVANATTPYEGACTMVAITNYP